MTAVTLQPDLVTSPVDKKAYRFIFLPNGLRALLIHDPSINAGDQHDQPASSDGGRESDGSSADGASTASNVSDTSAAPRQASSKRAAAALAVGVGSFADPEDLQGLSHYLEHMLFMGSAEFPDENGFDDFLNRSAGSSNAFTETEHTNFHFEIEGTALLPALRRFAAFFKSPLCAAAALEREVLAVDSEFTGVLQDDQCRMLGMLAHTAPSGHPLHRFVWGNKRSLWDEPLRAGIAVRDRILAHHAAHYSAAHMRLVVLGGLGLDDLEVAVHNLFSEIREVPGAGPPSIAPHGPPFSGARFYAAPAIHAGHNLALTFQLPSLLDSYGTKAEETVAHLVGHEGPGSLLTALRLRKWATGLVAGVDDDGLSRNSGFFLFQVAVELTEAGLAAPPGRGLAVVRLAFEYLALLRDTGPQEWVWRENAGLSETRFRYKQESDSMDTVTQLASDMLVFAPEHTLAGGYLYAHWDAPLIARLLACLSPHAPGFRIDLQTSSYGAALTDLRQWGPEVHEAREPWFGMDYAYCDIPAGALAAWYAPPQSPELCLPPRNPYVPSRLALLEGSPPTWLRDVPGGDAAAAGAAEAASLPPCTMLAPRRTLDEPGLRVWHRQVTAYSTPRAFAIFRLSSPALALGAPARAKALLLVDSWLEALTESTYQAELAGLGSHINLEGPQGIEVSVTGFSCRLPDLVLHIFKALRTFKTVANWSGLKEHRIRRCQNALLDVSKHANWLRLQLLLTGSLDMADIVGALAATQAAEVEAFGRELLHSCHVEALVEGNMSAETSLEMVRQVWDVLGAKEPLVAQERVQQACIELPQRCVHRLERPVMNPEERNSVVQLYLQLGTYSVRLRTLQLLLEQVLSEPLYNELRTQQQLGYSVSASATWTGLILGYHISVVTERGPGEVEAAVEAFLASRADAIAGMAGAAFAQHVSSLTAVKSETCNNIAEQGDEHWSAIWRQAYTFYERFQVVKELEVVTQQDLHNFYIAQVAPDGVARRKLLVCVHSRDSEPNPSITNGASIVSDIGETKAMLLQAA